ncbi:ABC transporter substrate-binding protein [Aestuariivirga sp.]|uniref:ABC transporter substrate-binding protein n=1 Tax=Aestuariivirga sp. TaxID=2650926 RepID=UPI0039E4A132
MLNRRHFLLSSAAGLILPALAQGAQAADWAATEAAAKGQTVYFNAWAGSEPINAYIAWAAGEMKSRYGVAIEHVKISDAAEVVKRVRDEVAAGKQDGSVDLVWINGENFRAMKTGKLLFGPFSEALPNYALVDTEGKPTTKQDFAESVDGLESPWGMAQLTFFADGAKVPEPPRSIAALTRFAAANPGRVTYPAPPDFHGTTFIKQVLIESAISPKAFLGPADQMLFSSYQPVWEALLDALHKSLWREGKQFPKSQAEVTQMVADGELLMGLTFNPNEPANLVAAGTLPQSTIAWQNEKGTIGNTHFVAIPVNAKAKEGAQVFANFLLSPEAQARKNDIKVWGDPTVLAVSKLPPDQQAAFAGASVPGSVTLPGPALLEPHASWVALLEAAWLRRYGKG